jgi:hypothetical protein
MPAKVLDRGARILRRVRSMKREAIRRLFTPDRKRILIFVILALVAFAGYVQSWVFSGKDMGLPKPPFFDLLAPFRFWAVWVMLLLALGMLSNVIVAIGGYDADFIMRGSFPSSWMIQLLYLYVVSCVIASVWTRLSDNSRGSK